MRDEVLEFLRQNQGGFRIGTRYVGSVSCFAHSYLETYQSITSKGYKLESYTKRGYRLLEEPDLLSPLAMKQILKNRCIW